jgi:hypothetical protein
MASEEVKREEVKRLFAYLSAGIESDYAVEDDAGAWDRLQDLVGLADKPASYDDILWAAELWIDGY